VDLLPTTVLGIFGIVVVVVGGGGGGGGAFGYGLVTVVGDRAGGAHGVGRRQYYVIFCCPLLLL